MVQSKGCDNVTEPVNFVYRKSGICFWKPDSGGRAVPDVGHRQFACWECGFESRREHGCLCVLSAVCRIVEISAIGWSLVQSSSIECLLFSVIKCKNNPPYLQWGGKQVRKALLNNVLYDNNYWMKRDQLDVTCFFISLFNAQHVSDVNTSIFRSLRLICWVISWVVLLWYDVCWC